MSVERRRLFRRTALSCVAGLAGLAVALIVAPSLFGAQVSSNEGGRSVATVDGAPILQADIEAEAVDQLDQVDLQLLQCEVKADEQRHEVLSSSAERVVRKRLLALEAERLGRSETDLMEGLRNSVDEVTMEEVDAWWEKNQNRVRQPREQVEDQIIEFLAREELQDIEEEFFDVAKERYEVEMMLDPFRLEVATAGFPSFGGNEAPVTIVEFSDFECPYCKRVLPTLEKVKENYGDNVRLVFRQFPLSIHANAQKAAEASLCARDQGKFWEMHDLMFDEQKELTLAELKDKAGRLELDQSTFDSCLDSGQYGDAVTQDLREGATVGVTGTPAFFVNGRKLSGAVDFSTVAEIIDDELARAGSGD